jgi:hypothetical protein
MKELLNKIKETVFLNIQTWNPNSIVSIDDCGIIGKIRVGTSLKTDLSNCYIKDNKIYNIDINYDNFTKLYQ